MMKTFHEFINRNENSYRNPIMKHTGLIFKISTFHYTEQKFITTTTSNLTRAPGICKHWENGGRTSELTSKTNISFGIIALRRQKQIAFESL